MSNQNNPYFIITAGPTASGKSSTIDKISNYLHNDEINNEKYTDFISVDALIEKNPYFKREIDNYFKKNFKNKNKDIYNELAYPTKKTITFFDKVYWDARKKTDCITGNNLNLKNKTKKKKDYKPCSYIITNNILTALKKKKNIVFETTGVTFPFWIFKLYPNDLMNYNIIITWSIVDICDLYERNKSRSIMTAKLFIETFADNAPRLPDIRKKNYKRTLINIIDTYKELVKYHGNRSLSKLRLLLFDNRTKKSNVLYDSYENSDKIGYREILKYNVHNNCDNKSLNNSSINKSISSTNKSVLPLSRKSVSPLSRKSVSPLSRKSVSPLSRKSVSPSSSSNIKVSPPSSSNIKVSPSSSSNIKVSPLKKLISQQSNQSIHPMIRRSQIANRT
jgi:hypothetical protein